MKRKMLTPQIVTVILAVLLLGGLLVAACKETLREKTPPESFVVHPGWSKNAVIYEVNLRQFTPEGTLMAFMEHLPRLKELGVDIIWFMPVHPIGEKNRKGGLGSYYSVQDYKAINPEFGTMEDFMKVVNKAHELGMYVILDWVANHTAWDNPWVEEHPEWYTRDTNGNLVAPFDWTDVVKLDYDNDTMRAAMIDALKFWVMEADIDGYRCDVAAEVPTAFWESARAALDMVKPVFMLAEAELPEHHINAFDMSYAWELHHIMNEIAKGNKGVADIDKYFVKHDTLYPRDAYRMYFITNHDENSWNGTEYERMGDAVDAFAVLTYTLPGMPLIYSGQEAALNERLKFFEKDTIDWGEYPLSDFYTGLGKLRKENKALWSGTSGGDLERIKVAGSKDVYAFVRTKEGNTVLSLTNMSPLESIFTLRGSDIDGEFTDWFSGELMNVNKDTEFRLAPWGYKVLVLNGD
jgi:glycosidase